MVSSKTSFECCKQRKWGYICRGLRCTIKVQFYQFIQETIVFFPKPEDCNFVLSSGKKILKCPSSLVLLVFKNHANSKNILSERSHTIEFVFNCLHICLSLNRSQITRVLNPANMYDLEKKSTYVLRSHNDSTMSTTTGGGVKPPSPKATTTTAT